MAEEPRLTIEEYLSMDETELMIELGRNLSTEPMLYSPTLLLEKARTYLALVSADLRALICPRRDLVDLPEVRLAIALSGLLAGSFALSIANILAVYIAKRGVMELCRGWTDHA